MLSNAALSSSPPRALVVVWNVLPSRTVGLDTPLNMVREDVCRAATAACAALLGRLVLAGGGGGGGDLVRLVLLPLLAALAGRPARRPDFGRPDFGRPDEGAGEANPRSRRSSGTTAACAADEAGPPPAELEPDERSRRRGLSSWSCMPAKAFSISSCEMDMPVRPRPSSNSPAYAREQYSVVTTQPRRARVPRSTHPPATSPTDCGW